MTRLPGTHGRSSSSSSIVARPGVSCGRDKGYGGSPSGSTCGGTRGTTTRSRTHRTGYGGTSRWSDTSYRDCEGRRTTSDDKPTGFRGTTVWDKRKNDTCLDRRSRTIPGTTLMWWPCQRHYTSHVPHRTDSGRTLGRMRAHRSRTSTRCNPSSSRNSGVSYSFSHSGSCNRVD